MAVYNIPLTCNFAEVLGDWLCCTYDSQMLPHVRVILPTTRSVRLLHRAMAKKPMLLPEILPLGEIHRHMVKWVGDVPDHILKKDMGDIERQLTLTQLIAASSKAREETLSTAQALSLAEALMSFMDQVIVDGMDNDHGYEKLVSLVTEDLAQHWQEAHRFLKILWHTWPNIEHAGGSIHPRKKNRDALTHLAHLWQNQPPSFPIVVAGSTASQPTTAKWIKTIHDLKNTNIILPGIDRFSEQKMWDSCLQKPTHPYYNLSRLLKTLGLNRDDVVDLAKDNHQERTRMLANAFSPQNVKKGPKQPCDLVLCEAQNEEEEAQTIALIMRECLEHKNQTATLVTPDRGLAKRVKAALSRWQIESDDSLGDPLINTPMGRRLYHLSRAHENPIDLLSALKQLPDFYHLALALEMDKDGKDGVLRSANITDVETMILKLDVKTREQVEAFLSGGYGFINAKRGGVIKDAFSQLVLWHNMFYLNNDDEVETVIEDLLNNLQKTSFQTKDMDAVFNMLFNQTVNRRRNPSPLNILGTLESRLYHSDIMILAGLNEGVWPSDALTNPWMGKPMQHEMGLQLPDNAIGLQAHDFLNAATAKTVYCTRAMESNGDVTQESRWLTQIKTQYTFKSGNHWLSWAMGLDKPKEVIKTKKPVASPPIWARPTVFSVTDIGLLLDHPYGFYAKSVLGLSPLNPLGKEQDTREYGIWLHELLHDYVKNGGDLYKMVEYRIKTFFLPQRLFFHAKSLSAIEQFKNWDEQAKKSFVEESGKLIANGITLKGRFDRLDMLDDGSLYLLDYKTGGVPKAGKDVQLPLLSYMVQQGGFERIRGTVKKAAFWQFGKKDKKQPQFVKNLNPQEAFETVMAEIENYMDEGYGYEPHDSLSSDLCRNPYEHLERRGAWYNKS